MKLSTLIIATLFCCSSILAQDSPVKWTAEIVKDDSGAAELVYTAVPTKGWVVYSQHTDPDGPVPTSFEIKDNECVELVGEMTEDGDMQSAISDLFGVEVKKFKESTTFRQKLKTTCKGSLRTSVYFMTCDGERCLPPKEIKFNVEIE